MYISSRRTLKNNNKMQAEQKELEKIEYQKRTWNSKFMRELAIFEGIAIQINSHTGKKQKYWCRVMDLYNKKYR